MPEAVIAALQKFGTSLRANVYGGVYKLAQEALAEYEAARADVARFLVVQFRPAGGRIHLRHHLLVESLPAQSFGASITATLCRGAHSPGGRRANIRVLPMTPDGELDLAPLPELVTSRCRIIAVTHCSNVTGALTDTAPIVAAARATLLWCFTARSEYRMDRSTCRTSASISMRSQATRPSAPLGSASFGAAAKSWRACRPSWSAAK